MDCLKNEEGVSLPGRLGSRWRRKLPTTGFTLLSKRDRTSLFTRVVSSEIFGNLLITYVSQIFPSPALQSDAVK